MKDLVASISVGKVGDKIVVDLNKEEEDYEGGSTDIPVAVMPRNNEITLLQLDGDITSDEIKEALNQAKKACQQIYKIQRDALKEKYGGMKNE